MERNHPGTPGCAKQSLPSEAKRKQGAGQGESRDQASDSQRPSNFSFAQANAGSMAKVTGGHLSSSRVSDSPISVATIASSPVTYSCPEGKLKISETNAGETERWLRG